MTDTTLKYFRNSMSGASRLSGTAGDLIGLLDSCLCDGFGTISPLTSLVVSNNVATATYNSGHNFAMIGTTGPVIRIAGSSVTGDNASALNGDWRVTVTSSTQFTFATSGVDNQTATGTISAKRAPAGWTKLYSGTNKAAYQRTAAGATSMILRVDDSNTTYALWNCYESMSSVDSGTDAWGGTQYVMKSNAASTSSRAWRVFADAYCVYLFAYWNNNYASNSDGSFFGDIASFCVGDNYHCAIIAATTTLTAPGGNSGGQADFRGVGSSSYVNHYLARSFNQITKNVSFYKTSHSFSGSYLGTSGVTYPSPMNSALITSPIYIYQPTAGDIRGLFPGISNPLHNLPGADGNVVIGGNNPGNECMLVRLGYGSGTDFARVAMDLMGPIR